jgi:hypothetical protein
VRRGRLDGIEIEGCSSRQISKPRQDEAVRYPRLVIEPNELDDRQPEPARVRARHEVCRVAVGIEREWREALALAHHGLVAVADEVGQECERQKLRLRSERRRQ